MSPHHTPLPIHPGKRTGRLLAAALLAATLSACGGGGGGGSGGTTASSGWSQQAYVKATNAEASDFFGVRVSISGDTMVVGAYQEDSNQTSITNGAIASADNAASDAGAAYVFVRSGGVWSQQAYLKAPNAEAGDEFGASVAISGDTIVVGTIFESSNQTSITNGSTVTDNDLASGSGAAYVFVRSGTTWSHQAYLKAPNAEASDFFGASVAISGDTLVVGASGEDSNQTSITNGSTVTDNNSASSAGAAYVFVRSGGIWSHQAYLKAPNAEAGDLFGDSVGISGDTIVVGAYQEDSSQTSITNGATASADNAASDAGAAYVFVRSGTNWSQQAYLKAPNSETVDKFGRIVAISGDTIVVGAPTEDSNQTSITNGSNASADNSATDAGAAYVFVRSGSNWSQQAYLKAANTGADDRFGFGVAISGDTIVVGAHQEDSNQATITNGSTASADDSATSAGAAYVFVRSDTSWSQQAYLKAPNAQSGDIFGYRLAISGDTIAIGAYVEDSSQTTITNGSTASSDNSAAQAGATYVFHYRN